MPVRFRYGGRWQDNDGVDMTVQDGDQQSIQDSDQTRPNVTLRRYYGESGEGQRKSKTFIEYLAKRYRVFPPMFTIVFIVLQFTSIPETTQDRLFLAGLTVAFAVMGVFFFRRWRTNQQTSG